MDSKDFRLLVELHRNARQSYRSLGHAVSLSAPAVRERLARLRTCSILQGYWLWVDPSIFGRKDLLVFYLGEWTREDALKLVDLPDIGWVAWKVDGGLTVQVWPHDDPVAATETVSGVLGKQPYGQTISERTSHRSLSLADWYIVDALIDDPLMSLNDLSEQTGLSLKTVRKRLASLVGERRILIVPKLGTMNDSGDVVYSVGVFGQLDLGEVRRRMKDVFVVGRSENPPASYLLCRNASISEATTRIQLLNKFPGVKSATISLIRETFVAAQLTHSLVKSQIQTLQKHGRIRSVRR